MRSWLPIPYHTVPYHTVPHHCWVQIEGQQSERNKVQQEKAALAKLDRIKQDQGKRADDLEREAADAESKVCLGTSSLTFVRFGTSSLFDCTLYVVIATFVVYRG